MKTTKEELKYWNGYKSKGIKGFYFTTFMAFKFYYKIRNENVDKIVDRIIRNLRKEIKPGRIKTTYNQHKKATINQFVNSIFDLILEGGDRETINNLCRLHDILMFTDSHKDAWLYVYKLYPGVYSDYAQAEEQYAFLGYRRPKKSFGIIFKDKKIGYVYKHTKNTF